METQNAVLIIAFVAAALAVEGVYALWNAGHGPEAQRVARRLRLMASGERAEQALSLLKGRHADNASATEKLLLSLPGGATVDRLLLQAGSSMTLTSLVGRMIGWFVIGLLGGWLFANAIGASQSPWVGGVLVGLAVAWLPLLWVVRNKNARMNELLLQLPEALDLVGRAMRAGHAFSGGIKMVADELRDPIGGEFRIVFDELSLGLSVENAMLNLSDRVDIPDMKYFVVTVLIQRDSGGNLAEILDKISRLIRERIRLFGRVRVLATQGRLEAWILTILPFAVAGVMAIIAPQIISVLWVEPIGRKLLLGVAVLMLLGIFVMWRMIKIRV